MRLLNSTKKPPPQTGRGRISRQRGQLPHTGTARSGRCLQLNIRFGAILTKNAEKHKKKQGKHEFVVSTYQACILYCFNNADKLSYAELLSQTKIPLDEFKRHLQSLYVHPKCKILVKQLSICFYGVFICLESYLRWKFSFRRPYSQFFRYREAPIHPSNNTKTKKTSERRRRRRIIIHRSSGEVFAQERAAGG